MIRKPKITPRQQHFNAALRYAMYQQDITQMALAQKVGVSAAHIQKILAKPNQWGSETTRMKIVAALDPDLDFEQFLEKGRLLLCSQEKGLSPPAGVMLAPDMTMARVREDITEIESRLRFVLAEADFDDAKELKQTVDRLFDKIKTRRSSAKAGG